MAHQRIWASLDPFLEDGPILGRRVANAQFLRFLLAEDPCDAYHFFPADPAGCSSLSRALAQAFPAHWSAGRIAVMERRSLPSRLKDTDYYCFHQSDCIQHQPHVSRLRNACSRALFPVTGPIHSLSYADYPARFLAHLWPGALPRDCIVATSTAGSKAVANFFAQLRAGYGLEPERFPEPSRRVIPLGVDTGALRPASDQGRLDARRALDLPEDRCLFLVFGRISPHSKMDLLPLLRAFQRLFAEGMSPETVGLVLAGWVEDGDDFPENLQRLAANIGLWLRLEARPGEDRKADLFAAADAFVSLADNPQETFGITLLEAGAAGLPSLVSDYDGYRDLVEHEATGLRVPSLAPADSEPVDSLAPLLFDSQYHLFLAQGLALDQAALVEGLRRLARSPQLRREYGDAARQRVEENFSWPAVIRRYAALWDELWTLPCDEARARAARHPLHLDYAAVFGHYATARVDGSRRLALGRTGRAFYQGRDFPPVYAGLETLVQEDTLRRLCFLARKPLPAADIMARLAETVPGCDPGQARFLVQWALKHDLLEALP